MSRTTGRQPRARSRRRALLAALAVAGAFTLVAADHAEARKAGSFGSRGSRTYTSPAPTTTAPGTTAPVQRSTTPQPAPSTAARPNATAPRPSMFGSGFGGALMRGLLIGGLVGLLMGQGLGGLAGLFGLLLQIALVVGVVMLVLRFMRRPQPAAGGGVHWRDRSMTPRPMGAGATGPVPGGSGPAPRGSVPPSGSGRPPAARDEIGIAPADLDTFERMLGQLQTAFSREDQGELRALTTPEVFGHLSDELRENAERGLRNDVTDVKLLQGDVAEAWREGPRDYATVAMRYASRDVMVDRASGRVVSGDQGSGGESTEVWTFVRERGGPWRLSAIQGA
ncbi:TIM44-like domain-containing protein [Xanthobacter sp. V3C-3]|uniref:Tim44 domain-containing protein n=1 Tax=Xanthobacter lutulentifluminis TaxID=3119935 RepID=UPI00372B4E7C